MEPPSAHFVKASILGFLVGLFWTGLIFVNESIFDLYPWVVVLYVVSCPPAVPLSFVGMALYGIAPSPDWRMLAFFLSTALFNAVLYGMIADDHVRNPKIKWDFFD